MQLMASCLFVLWGLFVAAIQAPCGESYFVAHLNGSIQLAQIRPGNKLVFEYVCQTKNFTRTIARDVGVRHVVMFEVDPQSHAFYLKDEELPRAKVVLSRHCRCKPLAYDHLRGTIQGHVSAPGQWEITLKLSAIDARGKEVANLNSAGIYQLP